jgi:hypothetical protein
VAVNNSIKVSPLVFLENVCNHRDHYSISNTGIHLLHSTLLNVDLNDVVFTACWLSSFSVMMKYLWFPTLTIITFLVENTNFHKEPGNSFSAFGVKSNNEVKGQVCCIIHISTFCGSVFHSRTCMKLKHSWLWMATSSTVKHMLCTNKDLRHQSKGNSNTKSLAYRSLVRPILEYGAACWDTYRGGQITALNRVQKRAAKFVHNTNSPNWKTFASHRKLSSICALFKAYTRERAWKPIGDRLKWPHYLSRVDHERKIWSRGAKDRYREIFFCE